MFSAQSYHAQQKLQQLDVKITNKSQALDALRTTSKADTKVASVTECMVLWTWDFRVEKQIRTS